MERRKRWTEEEDLVIFRLVSMNITNMKAAFQQAAQELGRTPNAVQQRWYSHVSKQKSNTAFMLLSERKSWPNKKNVKDATPAVEVTTSLWQRLLRALGFSS